MIFGGRVTGWVIARDLAFVLVIYTLGLIFAPRALFLETLNGILLGICLAVVYIYAVRLPTIIIEGNVGLALIRVGIIGSWTVAGIQAIVRVYYLEFHPSVQGRAFDATGGAFAVGYIIFAVLHIIAINVIENKLSRQHLGTSIIAILGGAVFTLGLHLIHLVMK